MSLLHTNLITLLFSKQTVQLQLSWFLPPKINLRASAASPRVFLARKLLRNVFSGVYGSFVHLCADIILWNFTTTDLYILFTCTSLTSRCVIATRPSHHRDLGRGPSRGPLKAYLLFFPNKLPT